MNPKNWKWSKEAPTMSGWYWYKPTHDHYEADQVKCLRIEKHPRLGILMRDGRLPKNPESWPGEWCGPIPEPHPLASSSDS